MTAATRPGGLEPVRPVESAPSPENPAVRGVSATGALASRGRLVLYSRRLSPVRAARGPRSTSLIHHRPMASVAARKRMIIAGGVIAGVVALLAVADLAVGVPFQRQIVMDAMFLLGAGVVGYMAYDAYKDIS